MTKEQIINYLHDSKDYLKMQYGVTAITLFGSYAKGYATDKSDIDIAVQTPLSDYFLLYDLKENLEKALHAKVDLIRFREHMNPFLKRRILEEGIYV
ncbi:MAG: type VII toxin-antitoxin system MntA family adenylyltransferase antitoxin [Sulfuricurvum sp.]